MGTTSEKKKQTRKYIMWAVSALIVLALAVLPMLAAGKNSAETQASILSVTAEKKSIEKQLIGGGQLSSDACLNVSVPENVKLTEYLVGNGDMVSEGDVIAKVDKVSVMTAITEVQETLNYLSGKITSASTEQSATSVTALAGGIVKVVYAETGDSVQDVMLEHGALAVLSLDGKMEVKVSCESDLKSGNSVIVAFQNGDEAAATVKSNLDGVLTVSMDDKDYDIDTEVSLSTVDGKVLGTGELYIPSPWNVTAYSGVISTVWIQKGNTVSVGKTLFSLTDNGTTAQYQQLVDQRQKYEELMQELFQMYRTETVTAPCDGIVTGIDTNGAFLLSSERGSWIANLLSVFRTDSSSPEQSYQIVLLSDIEYSCTGTEDCPAQTHNPDCKALCDGSDICSAANHRNGCLSQVQEDSTELTIYDVMPLLNDVDDASCTGTEDCPAQSHDSGCKALCDRTENCTAINHKAGCLSQQNDNPPMQTVIIVTPVLSDGIVGQPYTTTLQATDGSDFLSGSWGVSGLPEGLQIDSESGVISGTPTEEGSFSVTVSFTYGGSTITKNYTLTVITPQAPSVYRGYVAQVIEVSDGHISVKQTPYSYTITDLNDLPVITLDQNALTEEAAYPSEDNLSVNDYVMIILDSDGTVMKIVKQDITPGSGQSGNPSSGDTDRTGQSDGSAGGGGSSGGGAMGSGTQTQTFTLYSLEKVTVASVTSQENMGVSITVDELDITKLYVGQKATVSVDALGGQQFDASITGIANSGSNSGGNSKFSVELTLEKSGEMLPGMYCSAFITLNTAEDVLCIPVAALSQDEENTIVYTGYNEESGLTSPVTVTIGVSDGENVQILSGLNPGETCYYAYFDTYVKTNSKQTTVSFNLLGTEKNRSR